MKSSAIVQVAVVVVSCSCGMFPFERAMHFTSADAWLAAAAHVALNPTLCHPTMRRDYVPAAFASSYQKTEGN